MWFGVDLSSYFEICLFFFIDYKKEIKLEILKGKFGCE